jgi:hypothetical protein
MTEVYIVPTVKDALLIATMLVCMAMSGSMFGHLIASKLWKGNH